ncbi:MAG: type II toxin-antitoxin system prevent-host-death family antitoxin [Verrucomicrobia bacterium]|nr:type II toxin-antitoxin system prevent-host-death family antitoxin [Verrucomicrobiota bacterium]
MKAKLSELWGQVAKRREPVLITRRGRPLVRIEPVGLGKGLQSSVWRERAAWERKHGQIREDFALIERVRQEWQSCLED